MFHVEQICPSIPRYAYSDIRRENKLFQTRHMPSIKQIKMHGENHIIPQRFGGMHLNRCRLVFNIPPTVAPLRGRGPLGPSNQAFEDVKYKSFYTMAVLQKRKLFVLPKKFPGKNPTPGSISRKGAPLLFASK